MSFRFPVAELAGSCHVPNEEAVVYDQCGVHITSNTRSMAGLSLEELVVERITLSKTGGTYHLRLHFVGHDVHQGVQHGTGLEHERHTCKM